MNDLQGLLSPVCTANDTLTILDCSLETAIAPTSLLATTPEQAAALIQAADYEKGVYIFCNGALYSVPAQSDFTFTALKVELAGVCALTGVSLLQA